MNQFSKFYLEFLFLFFISMIYVILHNVVEGGQVLLILVIASNAEQLYRYRNNDIILIFLFFIFLFWIYLIPFYFFGIPYHLYDEFQTIDLTNKVLFLNLISQRIIFYNLQANSYRFNTKVKIKKNDLIFILMIFILIAMLVGSLYGKETIIHQEYSIDTDSSIWFEYALLVFIVAFLYTDTWQKRMLLLFIGVSFVIGPFLFGRRLPGIMMALLIFNLYFNGRYKTWQVFFAIIFAFISIRYFGEVRNTSSGEYGLFTNLFSITLDGVMSSHQGGVIICTTTYLGLIENGTFDIIFSLKSFLGQFTSVLIPSEYNLNEAYINLEALKYSNIPGNGGLPSVYFYLWFGYVGVFIMSFFINYILRNIFHSKILLIYAIFMLSTFPRWYSYNMMILIKMGFWLMLLYFLMAFVDKYFILNEVKK